MKKAIIILISVLLITSFAACRNGDAETTGTTVPEDTSAESAAESRRNKFSSADN